VGPDAPDTDAPDAFYQHPGPKPAGDLLASWSQTSVRAWSRRFVQTPKSTMLASPKTCSRAWTPLTWPIYY